MEGQEEERYSERSPRRDLLGCVGVQTGFSPEISELSAGRHVYDVRILVERGKYKGEEELIEGVDMSGIIRDDLLDLQRLLYFLREEANIEIKDHQILLYLTAGELYVNFGVFPFLGTREVQLEDFLHGGLIRVKLVSFGHSLIHFEMLKDPSLLLTNGLPTLLQTAPPKGQGATIKPPRPICVKNFQRIGYIVKKVISLKSGQTSQNTPFTNDRPLSKKSLQDYYYNIRLGFHYKFDFNEHSTKNMKYLRKFVKDCLKGDTLRKRRRSTRGESFTEAGNIVDELMGLGE